MEQRAQIHNATPRNLFQLNGNNPTISTFRTQADISNICQFDEWCYYWEEGHVQFPFQKQQLDHVLGLIKNDCNEMTQAVLNIPFTSLSIFPIVVLYSIIGTRC